MDNTLEEKKIYAEGLRKARKIDALHEVLAELESESEFETQKETWWEILRFWIRELRWRRVFWEKMGHPHKGKGKAS